MIFCSSPKTSKFFFTIDTKLQNEKALNSNFTNEIYVIFKHGKFKEWHILFCTYL